MIPRRDSPSITSSVGARCSGTDRWEGGPVTKIILHLDAFQQRHRTTSYLFGVVKKYGDDRCGSLAALLAYYGFLSLFPLLLLLFTMLGLLFGHDAGFQQRVIHSALAQFPVVGNQLARPGGISSLKSTSAVGLVVSVIILLWGSLGVTQAGQRAMSDVWNVPHVARPGFVPRLARSLGFLGVLVLDVVVSTVMAGFVTSGAPAVWMVIIVVVAGLVVNVLLFILGFRILTPKSVATAMLLQGAIVAAIGWSLLQYGGTWLVTHELRHASQLYGYFASILGLLSFLYLAAVMTLYAAESNVVRTRRLYPRSMVQPPLTAADEAVLTALALQSQRRPEESIGVTFLGAELTSSDDVAPLDPDQPGDVDLGHDEGGPNRAP
jgi:YihY family inner membrane protein